MDRKTENLTHDLLLNKSINGIDYQHRKTGCAQCKFWDPDIDVIPSELKETHRICMKALYYDGANSTTHMITNDIDMVNAVLYTRFDHSCNEMTES